MKKGAMNRLPDIHSRDRALGVKEGAVVDMVVSAEGVRAPDERPARSLAVQQGGP